MLKIKSRLVSELVA